MVTCTEDNKSEGFDKIKKPKTTQVPLIKMEAEKMAGEIDSSKIQEISPKRYYAIDPAEFFGSLGAEGMSSLLVEKKTQALESDINSLKIKVETLTELLVSMIDKFTNIKSQEK